jgi:hypothetical protein
MLHGMFMLGSVPQIRFGVMAIGTGFATDKRRGNNNIGTKSRERSIISTVEKQQNCQTTNYNDYRRNKRCRFSPNASSIPLGRRVWRIFGWRRDDRALPALIFLARFIFVMRQCRFP